MNDITNRRDTAEKKRVELHIHTKMSAMDALISPTDAVKVAKAWGHSAIAITDHDGVKAFPEAMRASEKYGIKVIYGIEIHYDPREIVVPVEHRPHGSHLTILVKNQKGLKNLYRLISKGYLEDNQLNYKFPVYSKSELESYREGLLFGSACNSGELFSAYQFEMPQKEIEKIVQYYDYLEIMPISCHREAIECGFLKDEEAVKNINRRIVELGEKYKKPVVATGDVHFLEPEDEIGRKIILSERYTEVDFDGGFYFRTTKEMLEEFSYLGEEKAYEVVVENTNKIADMIEDVIPIPKGSYYPHLEGAEEELKHICENRFKALYSEEPPQIARKRLNDELSIILKSRYATLFMIAKQMVEKSESLGYHVGARGCVGASFVAYLLGITDIDPLEYDIPYEIFLGYCGDREPDIALNISPKVKRDILALAEELFDANRVFAAGTNGTLSYKTAYAYANQYFDKRGISVSKECMEATLDKCVGILRNTKQHPGGIMVVPQEYDVYDFTPIQHPTGCSDVVITHFNFTDLYNTILKIDILEYDLLTQYKLLEELTGVKVADIPLDDPKVLELFTTGNTLGLPEFGTPFVIDILKQTQPKSFDDLLKISGVTHGTNTWNGNAEELIQNQVCTLSDVVALREDIMLYLVKRGIDRKTAFGIMESVRKGKGFTAEQEQTMKDFGVPEWYIESCKKIKYLFPKAHAAAYVMSAVRLAWFKLYYPAEFFSSTLTVKPYGFENSFVMNGKPSVEAKISDIVRKGKDATPKEVSYLSILYLVNECMSRGINFLPVNLEKSEAETFLIENRAIRMPITAVWGTGLHTAQDILKARKERNFESVEDLQKRANLSNEHMEIFRKFGVLDEFDK